MQMTDALDADEGILAYSSFILRDSTGMKVNQTGNFYNRTVWFT